MEGKKMKKLLSAWIVAALSIYLTSLILGGGMEFSGFWAVALTALVVGLLNFLLKPLLNLLTCPVYLLTLGLSRFLVSGLILLLASSIIEGFVIAGFWWAVLAAIIIAILTSVLESMLGQKKHGKA
jgi:putative membrane protein